MADAPTVPCGHVLVPSMMAEALTGVDPACPQCGVRMDRFDALYAANERGQDCGNCGHWSDVHADDGRCGECECPTLRRLWRYLVCPGPRWASW